MPNHYFRQGWFGTRRGARYGRGLFRSGAAKEGVENALAFQLLANIDLIAKLSFAQERILGLLTHEAVTVTPEVKDAVWSALSNLAAAAPAILAKRTANSRLTSDAGQ